MEESLYEPLYWAEELEIIRSRRPGLWRWLLRWKPNGTELGLTLLMAVVAFGFQRNREAVQRVVAEGTKMVRVASRETLQLLSGATRSPLQTLVGSKGATGSAVTLRVPLEADDLSVRQEKSSSSVGSALSSRWDKKLESRVDSALVYLLGFKLGLLVLYTMPISYGFGVKRHFLHWASRSQTFRIYLSLAPFASLAVGACAAAVIRRARVPVERNTIQRWKALAILNAVLTYCTSNLFELIRGDPRPVINVELTAADRDLLAFKAPPATLGKVLSAATWPYRRLCPAVLFGLEELQTERRKLLFVGNHVIWGLDVPLLLHGLWENLKIWPRPLGEHAWFSVPGIKELMHAMGGVDGTRHNCDLLMERGDCLLVYPGGAREAWKRTTDPRYAILWGEHHLGFVRMAVKHGYTIVPFATVGTEDIFEPVVDLPIREIVTLGGLLAAKTGTSKAFEPGARFPVVRPRLSNSQRVYYKFMPPISTTGMADRAGDETFLRSIRDESRNRLQEGIDFLLDYRRTDPDRYVFRTTKLAADVQAFAAIAPSKARL